MPCLNPHQIVDKNTQELIMIPCRKCVLCRQKKARDWAIKLIKESMYYKKICMITLTFSPKFLMRPYWVKLSKYKRIKIEENSGYVRHILKKYKEKTLISPKYITDVRLTKWLVTRFIKKIRKEFAKDNRFISYFAAGEHGTQKTHRAHWHIIFFGINKEDLKSVLTGKSKKNKDIYMSPIIMKLWTFKKMGIGKHVISDVTPATIKYVANYTLKKMYKEHKNNERRTNNNNPYYPTCFLFSNQNKIGYKWIRRNPYKICKGFIEDYEGGKYSIPEGYKKELKRYDYDNPLSEDCFDHLEALEIYEAKMHENMKNIDYEEYKKNLKRKAERLEYKIKREERDTEF